MTKKLFGRIPEVGSYQAQLIGWKTIGSEYGTGQWSLIIALSAFGRQLRFTYVREGRNLTMAEARTAMRDPMPNVPADGIVIETSTEDKWPDFEHWKKNQDKPTENK